MWYSLYHCFVGCISTMYNYIILICIHIKQRMLFEMKMVENLPVLLLSLNGLKAKGVAVWIGITLVFGLFNAICLLFFLYILYCLTLFTEYTNSFFYRFKEMMNVSDVTALDIGQENVPWWEAMVTMEDAMEVVKIGTEVEIDMDLNGHLTEVDHRVVEGYFNYLHS